MGRTACTEPQCLYKGALYLFFYLLEEVYTCAIRLKKPGGINSNDEVTRQALCVLRKMVTLSRNDCCNGNTALLSVGITELSVAASNIKNMQCYAKMFSW